MNVYITLYDDCVDYYEIYNVFNNKQSAINNVKQKIIDHIWDNYDEDEYFKIDVKNDYVEEMIFFITDNDDIKNECFKILTMEII